MSLPMVQALGTVLQVSGTLANASSSARASNYNAGINDRNSALALEQGAANALQTQRIAAMQIGKAQANIGASGIRSDMGSPLDVLAASAAQSQLEVENIRYNAMLRSQGFANSATLDRSRADTARRQGLYSAASQALVGGSKAYSLYNKPSNAGTPIPVYDLPSGGAEYPDA